jgi:hypothetical protein
MGLPLALSVHRFVSSVGAYAGFASIIGLAILVLLFFAQARETSALRDHVDELLERIAGLESRLARQAQAQAEAAAPPAAAVAEPVRQAAPALAAVGASRVLALPPAPPAGVGAPALSAATRVVPLGVPAGAALAARSDGGSGGGGVATAPPPAPATPAGATNGSSVPRPGPVPVPAGPSTPSRPAAARPPGGSMPVRSAGTPSAGASRRAAARPAPPSREPAPRAGGLRLGRLALIAVAVLAVGAAVAGAVVLNSSNSNSTSTGASRQSTTRTTPAAQVNPRTVTVAVLNGTSTAGLAHRTSQRLVALGFAKGAVTTAADQTRTSTTVAYIPGARNQALAVARALKLGAASVAPVDQGTRTVACGGLSTCTASVMVTVGSDLASQ